MGWGAWEGFNLVYGGGRRLLTPLQRGGGPGRPRLQRKGVGGGGCHTVHQQHHTIPHCWAAQPGHRLRKAPPLTPLPPVPSPAFGSAGVLLALRPWHLPAQSSPPRCWRAPVLPSSSRGTSSTPLAKETSRGTSTCLFALQITAVPAIAQQTLLQPEDPPPPHQNLSPQLRAAAPGDRAQPRLPPFPVPALAAPRLCAPTPMPTLDFSPCSIYSLCMPRAPALGTPPKHCPPTETSGTGWGSATTPPAQLLQDPQHPQIPAQART